MHVDCHHDNNTCAVNEIRLAVLQSAGVHDILVWEHPVVADTFSIYYTL